MMGSLLPSTFGSRVFRGDRGGLPGSLPHVSIVSLFWMSGALALMRGLISREASGRLMVVISSLSRSITVPRDGGRMPHLEGSLLKVLNHGCESINPVQEGFKLVLSHNQCRRWDIILHRGIVSLREKTYPACRSILSLTFHHYGFFKLPFQEGMVLCPSPT